jgi:5-methyltetrahydropteroyltriglutamate--homocysteine methyltransferase
MLQAHWKGDISEQDLLATAQKVEESGWSLSAKASISRVAVGDFALYDQVLQYSDMLGLVPARFAGVQRGPARQFAMARGIDAKEGSASIPALDMTK